MARTVFAALAFVLAASAAQAGPTTGTRHDAIVSHQPHYWLSSGLTRLAFWQTVGTRREEAKHQ